MKCNKCQVELPAEACFCLKCGEKVKTHFDESFEKTLESMNEVGFILMTQKLFFNKYPDIHNKFLKFLGKITPKQKEKMMKELEPE
ncbi:MAG: hypothetical protein NT076_01325 [Candidatus Pacearchaeota archaeon]|nr:hypothetical protein [Candidatus Pacearchaeota archaeon]